MTNGKPNAREERSFQLKGRSTMSDTILAKGPDSVSREFFSGKTWPADAETWLKRQIELAAVNGVFTITVRLTPALAQAILSNNPGNRVMSERKSSEYARDIAAGRWAHNGETIIISETGELNDGQHRCRAVIMADAGIITQMTFGVGRDTRATVDVGVKRTASQHLGMSGYPHYVQLSLAIATVLTFKKSGRITKSPESRPTSSEIMEWAAAHPEMQESVLAGLKIYRGVRASAGMFGGLHYLFAEKSREDADSFFASLAAGENLSKGDPIFELRALLLRDHGAKAKLPDSEIAARTIKAWNAYRLKRPVALLRMSSVEQYPVPR